MAVLLSGRGCAVCGIYCGQTAERTKRARAQACLCHLHLRYWQRAPPGRGAQADRLQDWCHTAETGNHAVSGPARYVKSVLKRFGSGLWLLVVISERPHHFWLLSCVVLMLHSQASTSWCCAEHSLHVTFTLVWVSAGVPFSQKCPSADGSSL